WLFGRLAVIDSLSLPGLGVISFALLTCCLTNTARAEPQARWSERRKVKSVRKYRLKAEEEGTAKGRRAFGSSYMTDAAIGEIVDGYAHLETLSASCHANVTDAGVARVCQLKKLKRLCLGGNRITNSGLESVSVLEDLEHSNCGATRSAILACPT
ncbi:MAG: hypothetical protein ABGZ17_25330, partial [Planctomycetaceae bacterium]